MLARNPKVATTVIDEIKAMAADFLDQADGDVQKATQKMTNAVLADQKLYRAMMDPLVRTACYDFVANQCRKNRKAIWSMPQPSAKSETGRILQLASGVASALMNFPLPGGKKLSEACRDEVMAAADFYQNQGADMLIKARWLQLVARKVPENKTVSESLTEQQLAAMKEKVS